MQSNSMKLLTPEEHYWWGIQSVLARHQRLYLSPEQAEMIYKYEQERERKSGRYFLSYWEECDFNLITFKEILTAVQSDNYESFLKTNISLHEEYLKTTDTKPGRLNELAYYKAMFKFYDEHLFPEFIDTPFKGLFEEPITDKAKIESLKKRYRNFLHNGRKKIIIEELRYNRTFSPNQLKISLLKHDVKYLWPEYDFFKKEMDLETKNIALWLENYVLALPDKVYIFINSKLEALRNFNGTNFKKYYANIKFDYVVNNYATDEEIKINSLMCFLLFDKNKYTTESEGNITESY